MLNTPGGFGFSYQVTDPRLWTDNTTSMSGPSLQPTTVTINVYPVNDEPTGLPDTPTTTQAGLPRYKVNGWFALLAPAGTPAPILEKLHQLMTQALNDPRNCRRVTPCAGDLQKPKRFSVIYPSND